MPTLVEVRRKLARLRQNKLTGEVKGPDLNPPPLYYPTEVISIGQDLLQKQSLPNPEKFAVMEQVYLAALDSGQIQVAKEYLDKLTESFPLESSFRVQKLHGQYWEAQAEWDRAMQIYNTALEQDETNIPIRKRIIMIYVAQGKRLKAIEELVQYVDTFMQDIDAWTQLANLYAQESMFQHAAFCYEELMMLKPRYPLYYIRYADIVAGLGKFELAVKYYCATLELVTDSLRALYGLCHVTNCLLKDQDKKKKSKNDTNIILPEIVKQLHELSKERLNALYQSTGKQGAQMTCIVKSWLPTQ